MSNQLDTTTAVEILSSNNHQYWCLDICITILEYLPHRNIIQDCRLISKAFHEAVSSVKLKVNYLKASGSDLLFKNHHLNINELDLHNYTEKPIRRRGCKLLVKCQSFKFITSLDLNRQKIGNRGAIIVIKSELMSHLKVLKVGWNYLESEFVEALGKSEYMSKLEELSISHNFIRSISCLDSQYLPKLRYLDASLNHIKDGVERVLNSNYCKLDTLYLKRNFIWGHDFEKFIPCKNFSNITDLDVSENNINNLTIPMANRNIRNLKRLILSDNAIRGAGLECILKSPYLNKLEYLAMLFCYYSEEEAFSFANQFKLGHPNTVLSMPYINF